VHFTQRLRRTEIFIKEQSVIQTDAFCLKPQTDYIEGELNPGDRTVETKRARETGINQTPSEKRSEVSGRRGNDLDEQWAFGSHFKF
jgi:hypothetical protein